MDRSPVTDEDAALVHKAMDDAMAQYKEFVEGLQSLASELYRNLMVLIDAAKRMESTQRIAINLMAGMDRERQEAKEKYGTV